MAEGDGLAEACGEAVDGGVEGVGAVGAGRGGSGGASALSRGASALGAEEHERLAPDDGGHPRACVADAADLCASCAEGAEECALGGVLGERAVAEYGACVGGEDAGEARVKEACGGLVASAHRLKEVLE